MSWYIEHFPWTVDDQFCVISWSGTPVHTHILEPPFDGVASRRRVVKPSFQDDFSPEVWSWRSVKR